MIIKSIQLENFRQYKGKQPEIKLYSENSSENVTIFLGDNTSGKTTLLQSFLWCLYEEVNFKTKENLLNDDIEFKIIQKKINSAETSVKLVVEYLGKEYKIFRNLKYTLRGNIVKANRKSEFSIWVKESNGESKLIRESERVNLIQKMFPKDLANYFFYDTERFDNITVRKELNNSVRGLLGLTSLENMISHIGRTSLSSSVLGKLYNELSEESGTETKELSDQNKLIEEKMKDLKSKENSLIVDTNKYSKKINEMHSTLAQTDKVSELEKNRVKIENKLKQKEVELIKKRTDLLRAISNKAYEFFSKPLINDALSLINNLKEQDLLKTGVKGMSADSINHILERGKCVCGVTIKKNSTHEDSLLKERELLPPITITSSLNSFKERTEVFNVGASDYIDRIKSFYSDIAKIELEINNLEEDKYQLSEQIKLNEDSRIIEENLIKYETMHNQKSIEIGVIQKTLQDLDKKLKDNMRKIDNLAKNNAKNMEIYEKISYLEEVLSWSKEYFEQREIEINDSLQIKINDAFQNIYHGDRVVKIDDKYNVKLVVRGPRGDREIDTSEGLETVKNFSFLAGLVQLAIEKREEDNKKNKASEVEPLPLVIDAPFSNADDRHVSKIAEVLPSVAEQLILIVMQKDFNHAMPAMEESIGLKYKINKISETHTEIKEIR